MLDARKLFTTWKPRVSPRLYVSAGAVILVAVAGAFSGGSTTQNIEDQGSACAYLPNFSAPKNALTAATATQTSVLNNQIWATIVNRHAVFCAVAFSGVNR